MAIHVNSALYTINKNSNFANEGVLVLKKKTFGIGFQTEGQWNPFFSNVQVKTKLAE